MWRVYNYLLEPLTRSDRFELPILNPDQVDNPDVPGITLTESFLNGDYVGGLFFANKEVELEYIGPDSDGDVEVRFELSGYPGDIEQFWEYAMAAGKWQGYTLANYLDQRPNPVGQPKAHHLPATVNPMLLVLRHVMGYNLFIIKLKVGLEGPNALDPALLSLLDKKMLPPHTAFIIFTELNVDVQEFNGPHDETLAVGSGPVLTDSNELSIDVRPPSVTGALMYI